MIQKVLLFCKVQQESKNEQQSVFLFVKRSKNQTIAKDKNGLIKTTYSGYILMPLYQEKGTEGFYIISKKN